jgi:DNA polymerase eta
MDCFYCQVEQIRLKIPSTTPLAVQQWDSVIAVNYPARHAGVTRHSSYRDCLVKCPELLLVHVPTYSTRNPAVGMTVYGAMTGGQVNKLDRNDCKASLQPYRAAGVKVLTCLRKALQYYNTPFVMEKASVDEVFIDISDIVDSLMIEYGFTIQRGCIVGVGSIPDLDWKECGCPAMDDGTLEESDKISDLRIYLGTRVSSKLRLAVLNDLSYTISAGIAHNKMFAKLASAKNKPDQQTFVRQSMANPWLAITPFNRIRFLGGKLGKALIDTKQAKEPEDGDVDLREDDLQEEEEEDPIGEKNVMATDLWSLSISDLKNKLGDLETAKWVYNVIRGNDNTPVTPRLQGKSFMSAKELSPPIKDLQLLSDWILLLVTEISNRLIEELQENNRWPMTITVYYKKSSEKAHSIALNFAFQPGQLPEKNDALAKICLHAITQESIFPCSRIALAVGRFKNVTADDRKRSLTMDAFVRERSPASNIENVTMTKASAKKKPRDLRSFFSARPERLTEQKYECPHCKKTLENLDHEAIREHQDYHYALQLQQDFDNQPINTTMD